MNEIRVKKDRGLFFRVIRSLLKLFKKKVEIVNLNEGDLPNRAIFVANHCGADGPISYCMYFPKYFAPWGAGDVQDGYGTRWRYMYHIFYRQKKGYSKFPSFVLATLFAIISRRLYRSARLIPSYPDTRFFKTMKTSFAYLDAEIPILIFPEDSSQGYRDIIDSFLPGFVTMTEQYYKTRQTDVPIYPLYYSKADKQILIGKPYSAIELLQQGKTREEVADFYKDRVNELAVKNTKARDKTRLDIDQEIEAWS